MQEYKEALQTALKIFSAVFHEAQEFSFDYSAQNHARR